MLEAVEWSADDLARLILILTEMHIRGEFRKLKLLSLARMRPRWTEKQQIWVFEACDVENLERTEAAALRDRSCQCQ